MFTAKETFSNTKNLSKLPRVITATELRLPEYFKRGEAIWDTGSSFADFSWHDTIFTGTIIHEMKWFTFTTYLKICKIVLEQILTPRDSNRFPSGECTRESVTNTHISEDI